MTLFRFTIVFSILIFTKLCFSSTSDELTSRMDALESRLMAMEKAITENQHDCRLVYKHYTYRLNRCDKGTFVRGITNAGANANQLECGYYQLQCPNAEN